MYSKGDAKELLEKISRIDEPLLREIIQKIVLEQIEISGIKEEKQKSTTNHEFVVTTKVYNDVTEIMNMIGIPYNVLGYEYLREAVLISFEDERKNYHRIQDLYLEIAKRYKTTSSKVERNIKYSISVAWKKGKLKEINAILGYQIKKYERQPTNTEIISFLTNQIQLEKIK